jgi:hypothetical protein
MTIVVDTAPIDGQRDGVPLVAEMARHVSPNDTVLRLAGSTLERRITAVWSDLVPANRQGAS